MGAQDLKDCLLIIRALRRLKRAYCYPIDKKSFFEDLGARNFTKNSCVSTIFLLMNSKKFYRLYYPLNPQPVVGHQSGTLIVKDNIVPDYIVTVVGGIISRIKQLAYPSMKINKSYANVVGEVVHKITVNSKLNAANWLIKPSNNAKIQC
ncbi:MAG: hypothetical protein R2822_04060 [Spirosomataceae bacterium]